MRSDLLYNSPQRIEEKINEVTADRPSLERHPKVVDIVGADTRHTLSSPAGYDVTAEKKRGR